MVQVPHFANIRESTVRGCHELGSGDSWGSSRGDSRNEVTPHVAAGMRLYSGNPEEVARPKGHALAGQRSRRSPCVWSTPSCILSLAILASTLPSGVPPMSSNERKRSSRRWVPWTKAASGPGRAANGDPTRPQGGKVMSGGDRRTLLGAGLAGVAGSLLASAPARADGA